MSTLDLNSLKRDYEQNGFVVIRGFLDASELEELRNRAIPLAKSIITGQQASGGKYRNQLKSLQHYDKWFQRQLDEGKHRGLMEHLMSSEVVGASAAWFDRPEGESQGLEPHVDALSSYWGADAGATIWYALDPVDVGNGCLHYLRHSHKSSYPPLIPIPGIDCSSEQAVAAVLDPGDAVIHNALTVHWSGGNTTGAPRRAVSYFYFSTTAYAVHQQHKRFSNDK